MLELMECPNEDCGHPIDPMELEDRTSFVCPNCGDEFEIDREDEDEDEEYEEETVEEEEEEEAYEEDDVDEKFEMQHRLEAEEPEVRLATTRHRKKPNPKKNYKRPRSARSKYIRHDKLRIEYLDFFIDHPDGVTIAMICDGFGLEGQAAAYMQRRTFADAEKKGYETEKQKIANTNKKLFFIRDRLGVN